MAAFGSRQYSDLLVVYIDPDILRRLQRCVGSYVELASCCKEAYAYLQYRFQIGRFHFNVARPYTWKELAKLNSSLIGVLHRCRTARYAARVLQIRAEEEAAGVAASGSTARASDDRP